MIYLALFTLAIWLSRASRAALVMSAVIGIAWSAHLPLSYLTDRNLWFIIVLFADMFIIYIAMFVSCKASLPIMGLSFMLCVGHLIDWKYETDPVYYQIANWLEYLEIVCCIIFSPATLNWIRKRVRHAY